MEILFSQEFQREYRKIKDKAVRLRLLKQIKKLGRLPESGKPLQHKLKRHRSVRIPPFRVIYRIESNALLIVCFDHRKSVYD